MKIDWAEMLTIAVLGAVIVVGMALKMTGAKEVALTIGGGLIGYLTKANNGQPEPPPTE